MRLRKRGHDHQLDLVIRQNLLERVDDLQALSNNRAKLVAGDRVLGRGAALDDGVEGEEVGEGEEEGGVEDPCASQAVSDRERLIRGRRRTDWADMPVPTMAVLMGLDMLGERMMGCWHKG